MASNSTSIPALPELLTSKTYLICYALPLLLISLALTFAGSFLMLDRTRRFKARYDALPGSFDVKRSSSSKASAFFHWFVELEGGIGGLMVGYVFGLHLSTFLALLIPATSSNASQLTAASFVPTYLLSSLVILTLGGRYSLASLLFASLSGGFTFALGVCIIIHPNLGTRIVLTGIFTALLFLSIALTLFVPTLSKFKHPLVRFACSSVGSFGVTMGISLLSSGQSSWSSPYSHLYLSTAPSFPSTAVAGLEWDTSSEKGFSALFCVLLFLGSASDWLLFRKFGECPDEKWDTYLAEYTAGLPVDVDGRKRAGTFRPFQSWWDRLFAARSNSRRREVPEMGMGMEKTNSSSSALDLEMALDSLEVDKKYPPSSSSYSTPGLPNKLRRYDSGFSPTSTVVDDPLEPLPLYKSGGSPLGLLVKKGGKGRGGGRGKGAQRLCSPSQSKGFKGFKRREKEPVKFRPLDGGSYSDSSNDDDDDDGDDARFEDELDLEKEMARIRDIKARRATPGSGLSDNETGGGAGGPPEYSDFEEEDITSREKEKESGKEEDWTPGFIKRHRSSASSTHSSPSSQRTAVAAERESSSLSSGPRPPTSLPVPVPVPATPSLLHALDRVEKARREAFTNTIPSSNSNSGTNAGSHPLSDHDTDTDIELGRRRREKGAGGSRYEGTPEGKGQRWDEFWKDVRERDR